MPYITKDAVEPRSRPGAGEGQEHPPEQPGVKFIAVEVKDRGEKGVWLRSNVRAPAPYEDKWYPFKACDEITWPQYHGVEKIELPGPTPAPSGPTVSDVYQALVTLKVFFKGT